MLLYLRRYRLKDLKDFYRTNHVFSLEYTKTIKLHYNCKELNNGIYLSDI